ncbi:dual specificity tyrosine-phosphorylation-regulated kinase 4-like [Petromyzon marinus]|uniref:dual specificity tyrosine-phosphorylation-regulated kinase 4-like n=1 Tax=Petromyzon marinus TaxID=7757 RepID=UPI003F70D8CE
METSHSENACPCCRTWSALLSKKKIRSKSPKEIRKIFGTKFLTSDQQKELAAIRKIWYFGLHNVASGTTNGGYDDDNHDYITFKNEHLNYRYEVLETIGFGGQGQAIKCLDHKTNTIVAVKMLNIPSSARYQNSEGMGSRIASALQDQDNEDSNTIHVLDHFWFRRHFCIVMELLGDSLRKVTKAASLQGLEMETVKTYTKEILKSLRHLRSKNIVHADLKLANVLLKDTVAGTVRLIDFESSFFVGQQPPDVCSTLSITAPEVLLGYQLRCTVDMWALGCMVVEMATGRALFKAKNVTEYLQSCIEVLGMPPKNYVNNAPRRQKYFDPLGKPLNPNDGEAATSSTLHLLLKDQDPRLLDFVSRCLQWDPNHRMTSVKALLHSWLQSTGTSEPSQQGAATTTATTTTTTTTTSPGSVQGSIALASRKDDANSGATERRPDPVQPSSHTQASVEKTEVVDKDVLKELKEETMEMEVLDKERLEVEQRIGEENVEMVEYDVKTKEEVVVEEEDDEDDKTLVLEEEDDEDENTLVLEEEETLMAKNEKTMVKNEEKMKEEMVEEEDIVLEKDKEEMEEMVVVAEGEKKKKKTKKRSQMARAGRAIRSFLCRVLLCRGRATTE